MKNTAYAFLLLFSIALLYPSCSSKAPPAVEIEEGEGELEEPELFELPDPEEGLPVSAFSEIWAYVIAGQEAALRPGLPITDVGYFSAEVDLSGGVTGVPNRRKLAAFPGRVHLVAVCEGRALSHFVLVPGSAERKALVSGLIAAAKDFDGLQIDFENVPRQDADVFHSFLAELRAGLGNKIFSVAFAARTSKISNDQYDYERTKPLVDRILVMAYDEHWSGSKPGPVASLPWCKRVANYALGVVGSEKLIMGLPFYGRAWGDSNPSRALIYPSVENVKKGVSNVEIQRDNGVPFFTYEVPVSVKLYYEDSYSLSVRMEMYKSLGVSAVGFWRLGQETRAVWGQINLE